MSKIIIICIISGLYSCMSQDHMNKYDWLPSLCAPENYPAEVVKGHFTFEDKTTLYIPDGRLLKNGWGNPGSMHVVGEDLKAIPSSINMTWLSYRENQFYTGHFSFPKEKLEALFQKGFIDRLGRQKTYTRIAVGLAPGGTLIVWLLGAGKTVEVGHFKAEKTQVSMKDFKPNAIISLNELVANRLERNVAVENREQPVPYGLWDTYRTKYTWAPQMEFQKDDVLKELLIKYYNGENIFTEASNPELYNDQKRAIPKHIRLEWEGENELKYGCKIDFNEDEVFDVFKDFFEEKNKQEAKLFFKINDDHTELKMYLSDGENLTLEIKEATIKLYPIFS